MTETISETPKETKRNEKKPSKLWYEVHNLADRFDKEVKKHDEQIITREEELVERTISSISEMKERVKKRTGKAFLAEIKEIELELDTLIGPSEEEEPEEEEEKENIFEKIRGLFM